MQALGTEKDVLAAELHKAQAALKGSGQEEVRVAALQKKAEDGALEVTNLQQLLAGASKEIEALQQVVWHPLSLTGGAVATRKHRLACVHYAGDLDALQAARDADRVAEHGIVNGFDVRRCTRAQPTKRRSACAWPTQKRCSASAVSRRTSRRTLVKRLKRCGAGATLLHTTLSDCMSM